MHKMMNMIIQHFMLKRVARSNGTIFNDSKNHSDIEFRAPDTDIQGEADTDTWLNAKNAAGMSAGIHNR